MPKQMSLFNEISEQFIGILFIKILKIRFKEWGFKEDIEGIKFPRRWRKYQFTERKIEKILFNYFEEEVDYFEKD